MVMEGGVQVQQECTQVRDEFRQTGDKGRGRSNFSDRFKICLHYDLYLREGKTVTVT